MWPAPRGRNGQTVTSRRVQREESRERIVRAAVEVFSERGFEGGSTRDVARRAGVQQSLVTYHFPAKYELWQAAADQVFATSNRVPLERLDAAGPQEVREAARELIHQFVETAARHPELFRFMVTEGRQTDERMAWLVDTHLRPLYRVFETFGAVLGIGRESLPHAFYVLVGAASVIFAVGPECQQLTGTDPSTSAAVDRHAAFVADLLVPP
jgi:TetR/AcrR family transcriptional regulator